MVTVTVSAKFSFCRVISGALRKLPFIGLVIREFARMDQSGFCTFRVMLPALLICGSSKPHSYCVYVKDEFTEPNGKRGGKSFLEIVLKKKYGNSVPAWIRTLYRCI